jgi:tetratricopeptide (TPR) repeat protein
MIKRIVFLTCVVIVTLGTRAQDLRKLQETFIEAEYFFLYQEFSDALPYYLQIYESLPDNANVAFRIGLCYLNIPDRKNLSVNFLETAAKNSSAIYREGSLNQKTAPYEALFHLGEAYRINYQFDNAKEAFLKYRETLLPDDIDNLRFLDQQIAVCDNAKELIKKPVQYKEENMGALFNDDKSNYNPIISNDGKSFAYMTGLKFYNAVMYSRLSNNRWAGPVNITPEIQLDGTVFISSFSSDGSMIYLSRNDNFDSDIFSSTFDGAKWTPSVKLNKNINTKYWESHACVTEDGESLIFASSRPGGFGGLDLYISKKTNGEWGPAVNLGPEINTPFNEDRPFLIEGGRTLFFISQGHFNMGGYDIFRADKQPNGLWSKPENLGYPLNTPDDDTFFMPTEKGKGGYVSKSRGPSENFGKEDIYKITFR